MRTENISVAGKVLSILFRLLSVYEKGSNIGYAGGTSSQAPCWLLSCQSAQRE